MSDVNTLPTFVSGMPGSGTSLLGAMLYQHLEYDHVELESDLDKKIKEPYRLRPTADFATLEIYNQEMSLPPETNVDELRQEKLGIYSRNSLKAKIKSKVMGKDVRVLDKCAFSNMQRTQLLKKAFPKSRFIVIYRNPSDNIEGWVRKWSVFRNESIETLCGFFRSTFEDFATQAEAFPNDVVCVNYDLFIEDHDAFVSKFAEYLDVPIREKKSPLKSHKNTPNKQKKGLRNVDASGKVIVSTEKTKDHQFVLTEAQTEVINDSLGTFEAELAKRVRFIF